MRSVAKTFKFGIPQETSNTADMEVRGYRTYLEQRKGCPGKHLQEKLGKNPKMSQTQGKECRHKWHWYTSKIRAEMSHAHWLHKAVLPSI
jgi:hypothetical protein